MNYGQDGACCENSDYVDSPQSKCSPEHKSHLLHGHYLVSDKIKIKVRSYVLRLEGSSVEGERKSAHRSEWLYLEQNF